MSPPPWRFKQVEVFPPPGMKNSTAPTVQADGHATLAPVAGLTQCPSFARSPRGGVAGAGVPLRGGGAEQIGLQFGGTIGEPRDVVVLFDTRLLVVDQVEVGIVAHRVECEERCVHD